MALLLETDLGDLVIDLDIARSPELCCNFIKLCKARYYTACLIRTVNSPTGFCGTGDPVADGTGGATVYGLIDAYAKAANDDKGAVPDVTASQQRFLKSRGRVLTEEECHERGRVVAVERNNVPDTIGSQFWITLGNAAADQNLLEENQKLLSLGTVVEDPNNVLDKIAAAYCDPTGRPYADIRIVRALVVHDPFEDPAGFQELMSARGVIFATDKQEDNDHDNNVVTDSPSPDKPPEENVPVRISVRDVDSEDTELNQEQLRQQQVQALRKEDHGRAVVLEMLGDLPSAEIAAPDTVLFCCKLNPVTTDEDLELIFSRFDPSVIVEIIRDAVTGQSLQYAFCEFTTKQQAAEAYLKMNNVLVDDRRISVDFSQSVSKIWDKYKQKLRMPKNVGGGRGGGGARAAAGAGAGRGGGGTGDRRGGGSFNTNNNNDSQGGRGEGRGGGRGGVSGGRGGDDNNNRRDDAWGRGRGPPAYHRGGKIASSNNYRLSPDNRPHQSHPSQSNRSGGTSGHGGPGLGPRSSPDNRPHHSLPNGGRGGPGLDPSPRSDSGRPDRRSSRQHEHEHEPRYDRDNNEGRRHYRNGDEDDIRDRRRGDSLRPNDYDREQNNREDRRYDRDRRDGDELRKHARGQDRPSDDGRDFGQPEHDRVRDRERSRDRSRDDRRDRDRGRHDDEKKSRDRHADRDNRDLDGSRDDRRDRDRDRHDDTVEKKSRDRDRDRQDDNVEKTSRDRDRDRQDDNVEKKSRSDDNVEKKSRDRDRHSDRKNRDNGHDRRSSKHQKSDRDPNERRSGSHRSGEDDETHDEEHRRRRRDKDEARGREHERAEDKDKKRHQKHHKHHKRDRREKGDSREQGDDDRRHKKRHRRSRSSSSR